MDLNGSFMTLVLIGTTVLVSWLAFNNMRLLERLILWPPAIRRRHQYDRLITHGFVHADFQHLLFNMITLYFFGRLIEQFFADYIGHVGFALFYLSALLVAILPTYLRHIDDPSYRSLGAATLGHDLCVRGAGAGDPVWRALRGIFDLDGQAGTGQRQSQRAPLGRRLWRPVHITDGAAGWPTFSSTRAASRARLIFAGRSTAVSSTCLEAQVCDNGLVTTHEDISMPASLQVQHDLHGQRFLASVDGVQAELDYESSAGVMRLTHTGVPAAIGGRGVAAELVRTALEYARVEGLKVVPACSYVAGYITRHPEYQSLLAS
jgi:predicted GNAT family acetyltransferase